MKKYKKQCKSTGGQILGTAGSAAMTVNPIVGGGLMAAGMVVDLFAKKKEEERLRKEERLLEDKNAMVAMGTGLAKGGTVKKAYNNDLASDDAEFQKWYEGNTLEGQNNKPYNDKQTYDYYSFYKNGEHKNPEYGIDNHFPDTYKRPSHPTFSNESIYSTPEKPGGSWNGEKYNPKGKFTGMAKGGEIKGKGTGTSDSIPAKLEKGDFIVPAKNAETALKIRQEHFGDIEDKSTLKDGDVPVNVSDGEVRFTKDEMDYLDEIGEGSKVRSLAPDAKGGNNKSDGGGVKYKLKNPKLGDIDGNRVWDSGLSAKDQKTTPEDQLKKLRLLQQNNDLFKASGDNISDGAVKTNQAYTKSTLANSIKKTVTSTVLNPVKTDLATIPKYTPPGKPSSKFGKFITENAGAILGGVQAIAGLVQGAKNANQERNLKPIQSNVAIANSEAIETKMTADKAANAIMAGNTAEADRATGNYMRIAKESGGANSATVLANASRVGQSSSDAYLKGMTTAAQLKMAGQQAGSEMKIKAGEQDTQVDMYNDQATRRLLETKSANANNLLGAGLQNTGMALARADYNKKMDYLKKNVKNNLTGQEIPGFKKGGMVKKYKSSKC